MAEEKVDVELHEFDGSDEIERKGKNEFASVGKNAEGESVGSGVSSSGIVIKGASEIARDEEFGAGAATEIKEETGKTKREKNTGGDVSKYIANR